MFRLILPLYVVATSLGLIFIKIGSSDGLPIRYVNSRLQFNFSPFALAGVFLYMFSFLLYMYLISKSDLGYIIPLTTALVYAVIFVASYIIFHETFTALKVAGIVLILTGLALINIQK